MRNIIKINALLALLIGSVHAESMHDNDICFNMSVKAGDSSVFVTPGQLSDNKVTASKTSSRCLTVTAGREDSKDPVNWIKDFLQKNGVNWVDNNMLCSNPSADNTPSELNFAAHLDVTFSNKYICQNVALGQGYNGLNNWWLFANMNSDNKHLKCTYFNGTDYVPVYLHFKRDNGSTYTLVVESTAPAYTTKDDTPIVNYPI